MGSRTAIEAFERAVVHTGIVVKWENCRTSMQFANGETAILRWCVRIIYFGQIHRLKLRWIAMKEATFQY